jgi:hypothetical protein
MSKKPKSPSRRQYHSPTPTASERESEQAPANKAVPKPRPDAWSGETRGATFLTIGWMLSTLATTVGLLAWLGLMFAVSRGVEIADADFILFYAMFFAMAAGFLTLLLGFFTQRMRRKRAPDSIRRFATIVGMLPWTIYATLFLFSR